MARETEERRAPVGGAPRGAGAGGRAPRGLPAAQGGATEQGVPPQLHLQEGPRERDHRQRRRTEAGDCRQRWGESRGKYQMILMFLCPFVFIDL